MKKNTLVEAENPLDKFDISPDITKIRTSVIDNIEMLRNKDFAFQLMAHYQRNKDKDSVSISVNLGVDNNTWEDVISLLIDEVNVIQYHINFFYCAVIEELYALQTNNKVSQRLRKKVEQGRISGAKGDLMDHLPLDSNFMDEHFAFSFALTLRQTSISRISEFLDYHAPYHKNFAGCLKLILMDYQELFAEKTIAITESWIEEKASQANRPSVAVAEEEKIQWHGTQKQLAELMLELYRNGYIKEINYQQIKSAFSNANTIQKVLQPCTDIKAGIDTYEYIYTKNYKPRFDVIRPNLKKK